MSHALFAARADRRHDAVPAVGAVPRPPRLSPASSSYAATVCAAGRLFAIPLLLNPLVLTIAPYPLQESVIVAGCLPLLFVLLAHRFDSLLWQCFIAGLCIGIAVMTRPTMIWIALPIALLVFYPRVIAAPMEPYARARRGRAGARRCGRSICTQAYIHWNTFHIVFARRRRHRWWTTRSATASICSNTARCRTTIVSADCRSHSPYRELAERMRKIVVLCRSAGGRRLSGAGAHLVGLRFPFVPAVCSAVSDPHRELHADVQRIDHRARCTGASGRCSAMHVSARWDSCWAACFCSTAHMFPSAPPRAALACLALPRSRSQRGRR